jgi:hypothetical protein
VGLLPFTFLGRLSRSIIAQKNGDGTIQTVDWISLVRSLTSCTRQRMGGCVLFLARVHGLDGDLILRILTSGISPVVCRKGFRAAPPFALCRPCSKRGAIDRIEDAQGEWRRAGAMKADRRRKGPSFSISRRLGLDRLIAGVMRSRCTMTPQARVDSVCLKRAV